MKKKTLLKSIWILLVMCGVSANAGTGVFEIYIDRSGKGGNW